MGKKNPAAFSTVPFLSNTPFFFLMHGLLKVFPSANICTVVRDYQQATATLQKCFCHNVHMWWHHPPKAFAAHLGHSHSHEYMWLTQHLFLRHDVCTFRIVSSWGFFVCLFSFASQVKNVIPAGMSFSRNILEGREKKQKTMFISTRRHWTGTVKQCRRGIFLTFSSWFHC